jgi:hypothetical protein
VTDYVEVVGGGLERMAFTLFCLPAGVWILGKPLLHERAGDGGPRGALWYVHGSLPVAK